MISGARPDPAAQPPSSGSTQPSAETNDGDGAVVAFFGLVVAGLIAGRLFESSPLLAQWAPPCLLRELSGVPCPTCGTTRVFVLLAHGHIADAFVLAPLPFALVAFGLVGGAWALLRKAGLVEASPEALVATLMNRKLVVIGAVGVVLGLWGLSLWRLSHGHPL